MNPLPLALATTLAAGTATPDTTITIYRSDADLLFAPGTQVVDAGHAVVHEPRRVNLTHGRQDLRFDGLPSLLDSEAVRIDLGNAARLLGLRVMAPGDAGLLGAHRGERILVSRDDGSVLADGILMAIEGDRLGVRTQDGVVYLNQFARVSFPDGNGLTGSSLQAAMDASTPGERIATLTYPTSGLGWRAAYSVQLGAGSGCTMQLEARASLANRSGRDFNGVHLKLVAGAPNFGSAGSSAPPYAMAMKAAPAPAPDAMPAQSTLGDYRSYTLDGRVDLPDASVTQVPLYPSHELPCTRRWLATFGNTWRPSTPNWQDNGQRGGTPLPLRSQLTFTAPENLPAGRVRVLTRDQDGHDEFLGEAHHSDTAKGDEITLDLGTAFGLNATRERTAFTVDRAARTMTESLRVTLKNGSDTARRFTVHEHPDRWRVWELLSSSTRPARKTPDLLEFTLDIPAHGKTVLDYQLRYTWSADDERG